MYSIVEATIYSNQMRFIIPGKSLPANTGESPGVSRLVIRRNLTTGATDAFVVTFTGDLAYCSKPDFRRKLYSNRFLKRQRDFSGTEVLSTLEGDFLTGYFIENGKRIKRFGKPVAADSMRIVAKSTYFCGYNEMWVYEQDCWNDLHCDIEPDPELFQNPLTEMCVICEWNWKSYLVPIYCEEPEDPCMIYYDPCDCDGNCGGNGGGSNGGGGNQSPTY